MSSESGRGPNGSERLRARFTRTGEGRDAIEAELPDGSTVTWTPQARSSEPPRDLVGLIVEDALRLDDGFWGMLLQGKDVIAAQPSNRMRSGASLSAVERKGLARSEAALGAVLHVIEADAADPAVLARTIFAACARVGVDPPPLLDPTRCEAILQQVSGVRRRWTALEAGTPLAYSFPSTTGAGACEGGTEGAAP